MLYYNYMKINEKRYDLLILMKVGVFGLWGKYIYIYFLYDF